MPRSLPRSAPLQALAFAGVAAVALGSAPALAQSETCSQFGKTIQERAAIVQRLNAAGNKNKKIDPKTACSMFGELVSNGAGAVKWLETNKDWCQIPDPFIENIKAEHAKAVNLRGQACKAAAQQAAMEKKAREGGGSGLLGGDGLTGSFRMPQGAL
ncbi:MAG TPA: hypothetical protein VF601_19140 [Beijerinckiaceae bacterium]|jgi:hypothetical protein